MRNREKIVEDLDEQGNHISDQQAAQFNATVLLVEVMLDIRELLAKK